MNRGSGRPVVAAALTLLLAVTGCGGGGRGSHPNVLMIILDTVRRDRLSCYGHDRPTTPNIDRLGRSGVCFAHAYANASWTLPSHATIFTGAYTVGHGADQETLVLGPELPTLAEILGEAGYETFGASTNGVVSRRSGLARGFGTFVETFRMKPRHRPGGRLPDSPNNMSFKTFLDRAPADRPFFAFINYVDAHTPYTPPPRCRAAVMDNNIPPQRIARATRFDLSDHYLSGVIGARDFELLGRLYDAEINQVDDKVAELLRFLTATARAKDTIVIIASDHGENLGEHGHFAHVFTLYETVTRIPLIIVFPDGRSGGTARSDPAQLIDLFPTILSMCGIDYHGRMDGRDLFADGAKSARPAILSEYYYPRQVFSVFDPNRLKRNIDRFYPFMRRIRAVHEGTMKLIWGSDGRNELYDIGHDPGETVNLLESDLPHPEAGRLEARMERMLGAYAGPVPVGPTPAVGWMAPGFEEALTDDPELLEKLRSLGYVR